MSVNRIAENLIDQYEKSWKMLHQAMENVPDEKWTASVETIEKPWAETKGLNVWYFSNVVYHIIQTIDFYTHDNPDDMKWGWRIGGIDWKTESPEVTASRVKKEDMFKYLEEVRTGFNEKIRSFSEDDLFEVDGFRGYLDSRLIKFIYALRHSMWHIGELGRALREWDCERIEWR